MCVCAKEVHKLGVSTGLLRGAYGVNERAMSKTTTKKFLTKVSVHHSCSLYFIDNILNFAKEGPTEKSIKTGF